ncbi:ADP-ribosylation/crystallin J1 [Chitinophaga agrisoli]|uniref:ADP-ribosylation/crystallin J1 n=1 Tax=Chitinophaga agrisoli TaxID=2607653 RepID=A0A5B2W5I2_9BACT|nr:ADP-ribosylation/crystallin J1 [Chitinophaga agrisoli]
MTLYRPVGLKELALIAESGYKAFPPRLFWQPIFYPVLNQAYAEQIALEWNTPDAFSGYCGVVTRFAIHEAHYRLYEVQRVGGDIHEELWVPADNLAIFNENIAGDIEVINAFFGAAYTPPEDPALQHLLAKFNSK